MWGDRALHAARNNADHYEAVFRAHRLGFHRDASLFRAIDPPPPYYSAALVLMRGDKAAQVAAIAASLARFGGKASVKDGFGALDLSPLGLQVGFHASWIWAEAVLPGENPGWQVVTTAGDLAQWELAWQAGGSPADQRVFPPDCLTDDSLVFCGRRCGAGFDAGCLVNRSGDIVGLSNVFGPADDAGLFPAALGMARWVGRGQPVAGFERGADLDAARAAGFADAGPLTVWFPGVGDEAKISIRPDFQRNRRKVGTL